ncbi:LLM class flavin-dependent oxidoreductase [Nocardia wallacei]|uniref:LLM class flavin-dependent oxidoreductase n=1 Tax=Nocardia wallacei TaxID=480035 RepID=UPI0024590552|nr:LLM class flavin-dependent oxidoreductase [Nocardia wallacei]
MLDTAPIVQGSTAAAALRSSVDLAHLADDLGYHRYWLPEHHGMRGVASAAPAVAVARIASATQHLRVGAGGVMLPNHAPLVVAEQFGTLEAFHPGRIDLGLGRALGGPSDIADRVRSGHDRTSKPFAEQIRELMDLFDAEGDEGRVAAVPAAGNRPSIWMLGSSDYTARVAGEFGLPFAFAHHLKPANTTNAIQTYTHAFQPSADRKAPEIMISVAAIVADTDEHAQWLAAPLRMRADRRRQGHPIRLPSPHTAAAQGYTNGAGADLTEVLVGGPSTVTTKLQALLDVTGATELMIKTDVYDHNDRRRSYELLMNHVAHRLLPAR